MRNVEVPARRQQIDATASLDVYAIDGVAAFETFGADINRLNLLSARPNPFLSAAFSRCYALRSEYHVPGKEERLFVVRDGDSVIGCLLMRRSVDEFGPALGPLRLSGARLRFLAAYDTEQLGLLCAKENEDRVAVALVRHICDGEHNWSMLELSGQRPGSALHRAMHAIGDRRFRARDFPAEPFNEIAIVWPNLADYFRSLLKKTRSNISRQARRLFAAGEVELILASGPRAVSAWFDAYCDLDQRSWKHGTESSIQRNQRRVRFYRELVAGRGGLDPSFVGVVLGGVLVAGLIAGSFAVADETKPHGAWCLEMAYDRSRAELGPGQLLLLLAMGEAIARGDQFLNFLHGFAYYKHRWAAAQIDVVNVQLIRRASIYNVRTLLGELKRRWVARRSQHVSGATIHAHDNDGDQDESGSATCNDSLTRSRDLTAAALAYTGEGVRRLDRGMSSAYLPFDLA